MKNMHTNINNRTSVNNISKAKHNTNVKNLEEPNL